MNPNGKQVAPGRFQVYCAVSESMEVTALKTPLSTIFLPTFFVLVLALQATAQSSGAPRKVQSPSDHGKPALSVSQAVITNKDVMAMLKAGLSAEIVAAKVRNSKCQCDTSPAGLAALKASGVPDSVILAMVQSATPVTKIPKGLANIEKAHSVYLVNRSTDTGVFDHLAIRLRKWGRWKISERPEDADVLLVFSSSQVYVGTMSTASVGGYGNYANARGISMPVMSNTRFLTAFDRASGRQLAAVRCARRMSSGYTAGVLVNRMKKLVKAQEKSK